LALIEILKEICSAYEKIFLRILHPEGNISESAEKINILE